MTNYKLFLIVLLANLSYSQLEKIIPSIVDLDGVVYKSNEEHVKGTYMQCSEREWQCECNHKYTNKC